MKYAEDSLDDLLEVKRSVESEIRMRASEELKELDARRVVLLGMIGGIVDSDDEEFIPSSVEDNKLPPKVSIPKYRDPKTGKTWSGKGKRPGWFDPDRANDFLISV